MKRRNEDILNNQLGKQLWIWVGVIVLLFAVISMFSSDRPKDYPPYVSHSPSPTGTKALYTYLAEDGFTVERWAHEPSLLDNEEKEQLLLMIEPAFTPSDEEFHMYEQFMERGNTIMLFSDHLTEEFDIQTSFSADFFDDHQPLTYGNEDYEINFDRFEQLITEDGDDVLLYDDSGAYGLVRSYGEGKLVVVNIASFLMNDNISDEDHAELVVSMIQDFSNKHNPILFNEYIHDSQKMSSFIGSYPFWFLVFIFQGGLLAVVWLFYKGKRFGPIDLPREDVVRFSDESVVALASWYMRGKRYQDSLRIQADYVKQLLYERWGIPYQLNWQERISLLVRRWEEPTVNIKKAIPQLEAVLMKKSISKSEYVQWSKLLDELRREVEEG